MNDRREGTHSGELQYAASNVAPEAAIRSMFGVRTNGCPYADDHIGPCSSDIITRKLGRFMPNTL